LLGQLPISEEEMQILAENGKNKILKLKPDNSLGLDIPKVQDAQQPAPPDLPL
jgi:hypothetical protein